MPQIALTTLPSIFLRLLLAAAFCGRLCGAETTLLNSAEITTAAGVRALSETDAARHLPVRLRGVVTYVQKKIIWELTLADSTAGVFIALDFPHDQQVQVGSEVEIRGISEPGGFAPYVRANALKIFGTAPVPPPTKATYDEIMSGRLDAQWIQLEGVVRKSESATTWLNNWQLEIAHGGGRVGVLLRGKLEDPIPVDAQVRVTGICFYQFTPARQVLRPIMVSAEGSQVEIIAPPPTALPLRSAGNLLGFTVEGPAGHRVRVRGTITHQVPGEAFWLDDSGHGLRVNLTDPMSLTLGERVEVFGFTTHGDYSSALEDVEVRSLALDRPIAPRVVGTVTEALNHDTELIRLDGFLTGCNPVADGYLLTLSNRTNDFTAHYPRQVGVAKKPECLQLGAKLGLTGICQITIAPTVLLTGTRIPDSFNMLIRSPADLTVLQAAPWWNPGRVVWILGVACAGLLLAAASNEWRARRRVREATLERNQAKAEFAAIWTERNRIAHELHDTLAQGLGAISLHLELVKDHLPPGESAARHLSTAAELTRGSLAEARDSIWNMRSQALETGDLATALRDVLQHLSGAEELEDRFHVSGKIRRLAPRVENNLLRIGQEAITNAIKHSGSKRVRMWLEFVPSQVTLRVADDGCGFGLEGPVAEEKHFGLVFMQERAKEIQGDIQVRSTAGSGTEITLAVSA